MAKSTRVGIYLRISEDRDGTQTATARQRADCEAFAASRGWEIADVFQDVDLSAYRRGVRRPEFLRMLEAVRSRQVDGVLAWKIDRLSRRQRDLVELDEACEEAGGFIATVTDGIDTRTEQGRFIASLMVAQARMESANTGERVRRKHRERAEQGKSHGGGWRPFGYTRARAAVIPEEAALIREAAERILAGEALRGICTDWAARGIVSPAGKAWHPTPLRRVLTGAGTSGQREYEGQLYPGAWPAILKPEETKRLRLVLGDQGRRNTPGPARKYLLSGMIYCGRCGEPLHAHRHRDRRRQYACVKRAWHPTACGRLVRFADDVEDLVTEAAITALDGVDLAEYLRQRDTDDARSRVLDEIAADEAALEQLTHDHYVERILERSEFLRLHGVIQARLTQNRQQAARTNGRGVLGRIAGSGAAVRERWDGESLDWKRAIIGALIDRVIIDPVQRRTGKFQPELVRIIWRF